jgi:hypothetical protein
VARFSSTDTKNKNGGYVGHHPHPKLEGRATAEPTMGINGRYLCVSLLNWNGIIIGAAGDGFPPPCPYFRTCLSHGNTCHSLYTWKNHPRYITSTFSPFSKRKLPPRGLICREETRHCWEYCTGWRQSWSSSQALNGFWGPIKVE